MSGVKSHKGKISSLPSTCISHNRVEFRVMNFGDGGGNCKRSKRHLDQPSQPCVFISEVNEP